MKRAADELGALLRAVPVAAAATAGAEILERRGLRGSYYVAAGMAGPVFRARVNTGCRTCPVASCCPVHPDGAQLGP